MTTQRPIIVVGCPRSGTTLLQLMLHAHPRIAIPPETRFLLTGYRARREFGDLTAAENRRALAKWIVGRRTHFADLGLDRRQIVEEIVAGPPTLGSAFAIVFRAYARRFDKPRWGDKRPAYLQNLHVIHRLFPDAQIVNIVRDGRDCVASLKEMPWNRMDIYQMIEMWNRGVDYGRRAGAVLGPGSYHELSYERLVADPGPELMALCQFLGEDYDDAMTAPAQVARDAVPERKSWHENTHGPVTTARVGRWRGRLTPWEIALCEAAMGSRLRSFGYELTGAGSPGTGPRVRYLARAARGTLIGPRRAAMRQWEKVHGGPEVRALPSAV
jgi:hypothetical protein